MYNQSIWATKLDRERWFLWSCCWLVTKSYLTLYDPMDCSMPSFSILPYFLEFAQTHAHCISDDIKSSHFLSSPSPFAFNLSSIRVFSNESALSIRWPKFQLQHQPFRWTVRVDYQSKGLSRVFSNTTFHKHQFLNTQHSLLSKSHIDHDFWKKTKLWLAGRLSVKWGLYFLITV